ncbi:uncharacterized protein [Arachis hypogaea]|uniref:uncharacterized protein n=1 Tax=Arachis hypogaea TaxID=3818 RepID=UPI003B212AE3
MEWERPTTVTGVRSFLDLARYYRRFIEGFSQIALSMTKLTRKEVPFVWTSECEKSFQTLKQKLTSAPVLILQEPHEPFEVYCDTSFKGLGCMLMQHQNVVAYASRQLRPHERFRRLSKMSKSFNNCFNQLVIRGVKNSLRMVKDYRDTRGGFVYRMVTPTSGIGRAIKTKKLNLRYIGPFEILRRFGPVAYQGALPPHLSNLHDVLHVSQLHKYTSDVAHVLEPESVELRENLTFHVTLVRIDDTSVKKLRGKEVSLVKVSWERAGVEEHTWELESEMRKDYPELFSGNR